MQADRGVEVFVGGEVAARGAGLVESGCVGGSPGRGCCGGGAVVLSDGT